MGITIPVVKRPQEDPVMTRSRITTSLLASLMALSLAGAPAAFAQTTNKDNMGKPELDEQRRHVQGQNVQGFDEEGYNVEGFNEERRRNVQGQYEKVSLERGWVRSRARIRPRLVMLREWARQSLEFCHTRMVRESARSGSRAGVCSAQAFTPRKRTFDREQNISGAIWRPQNHLQRIFRRLGIRLA